MNKKHLHNHIIINAYMPDGASKFLIKTKTLMEIRELSDEIQHEHGIELKFADPRSQLAQSKGRHSYREWSARQQNVSWKEEMKDEMAAARSMSDNREDFIAIMQDNGYEIARQEANSITWWNKTHTRKHPEYTLSGVGFSGVSAMDAKEILAFFKGTRTETPACLRKSVDVTMERVYHKRNEYLKQTFDKPIQKYQAAEISALLSDHGITMDVSALTQFDVINILW